MKSCPPAPGPYDDTKAFPGPSSNGMSLRDYFAGQALVGMMANYTTAKFGCTEQQVAIGAYAYADAMLAAKTAKDIAR